MSLVLGRERVLDDTVSPDAQWLCSVEYGHGEHYDVSSELQKHLDSVGVYRRRRNQQSTGLPLVLATKSRLVRLRKSDGVLARRLLLDLMVYARFELKISRGELIELNAELDRDQREMLKSMMLRCNRGVVVRYPAK